MKKLYFKILNLKIKNNFPKNLNFFFIILEIIIS